MKRFSLFTVFAVLLSLIAMNADSQTPIKNYESLWTKVEGFVKKNLPASALTEVKNIYSLAKKEKQDAQVIKALIYMGDLQNETRESNDALSIGEIEKEITGTSGAVNALLNSLLATKYWSYYQSNRWTIRGRTETTDLKKTDLETWTAEDFFKKTGELYLRSLAGKSLLQKTKLSPYDAIITKGNMRHLRPTLYDLLAFQALNYFENDERDLNKPSYAFEIDQAAAFDPAADFIHRKFQTNDTASLQHKALLIYQDLLAFHLNDEKPDALIDADIKRYQFVRKNSTHPDKEELYFNGVNHIAHQYENMPAASQAWYLVAEYYNQQGNQYQPYGDTTFRFSKIKAKEIAGKITAQKDSSEGKVNAINLLSQLDRPAMEFNIEQVNLPGKPFRALISYRNINVVYFRLVKSTPALKKALERSYEDSYWKAVLAASPMRSWNQPIPDTRDLQQHKTEIKIDALASGEYFLIASSDESFSNKSAVILANRFYVSAISYINNLQDHFVLDRGNGQPLRSANVQIWEQVYDYSVSKYVKVKGAAYITDENGFFHLTDPVSSNKNKRNAYASYTLEITTKDDHLLLDRNAGYFYYNNQEENKPGANIFLFKDRGIYRPGQILYFKGIALTSMAGKKQAAILPGYSTIIRLRNANGENIDSLKVTTNEFGSFSGKFQVPSSGLTGLFSIVAEKENAIEQFSVEEYKRPKFYVEFEPLKGTYRVNDSIEVTGMAKAYAGNNIDGAQVKYRVVRQARFLYPWLFRRIWLPPASPVEIAHGETTTDANGRFRVKFTAIPDLKLDPKSDPAFDYAVYADITDINGETRSGEKNVSVSYKSLLLKAGVAERMPADSLNKISIRTENNNGEFEPALVTVEISRLKEETRLIRKRLWERPDQFVFSKEEYLKYFPYDEYNNETDAANWEKDTQVLLRTDSTKENKPFLLDGMIAEAGTYMIEISTKDKDGKEVKDIKYVKLFDIKAGHPQPGTYFAASDPSSAIEPGQQTNIEIESAADNLFVVQYIDKADTKDTTGKKYSFIKLNNEKKKINLTADGTNRGGYGISWAFVKHNQFFTQSELIDVPWSNKELTIGYASYRDKTLPGSKEEWKLKISGKKTDKVAAEVLAGMYDASLDQFAPGDWRRPGIWPVFASSRFWNAEQNFVLLGSQEWHDLENVLNTKQLTKMYDAFSFGYRGESKMYFYANNVRAEDAVKAMPGMQADHVVRREMKVAAPSMPISYNNVTTTGEMFAHGNIVKKDETPAMGDIQPRKNFNETAFFFPDLRTDSTGAIEFSFTMPEALTKWKFQAFAHTKDLALGYSSKEIVTQKELMIQPNTPRFLREGDQLIFNAKIVNLSQRDLNGNAELQLFNTATGQPVNILFDHTQTSKEFKIAAGQSTVLFFPLNIPASYTEALTWRIVAKAENFSDGEENMLPVLSNRMLVTEAISLPMRGNGTKNFSFDKLKQSGNSNSLQQYSLMVEYTSNPVMYAVQALPYLMEYPYDCAEQTWNRYYANTLASSIVNVTPALKQVFDQWKNKDTAALMSNLQKNQELKSILLEETPWVLAAKTEAQQKQNIVLLFDMIRMNGELNSAYEKLKQLQSPNGGFVWFSGGPDDRYMTQYIVTGIGHLMKLKSVSPAQRDRLKQLLQTAIPYLDNRMKEEYDQLVKSKTDLKKYVPGYSAVQYFYMRSFFPDYKIAAASQTAYNYFKSRLPLNWTSQNKYMQGMTALALYRSGDKVTPAAIMRSLKETSINNEELGMYWKDASRGWWWYEAPIERQALLIEAFSEVTKDTKAVNDLRTWLLKNKQTNKWESTKATAEACYALLLQGSDWTNREPVVNIRLGDATVNSTDNKAEIGTGYFTKTFRQKEIRPAMGNIAVTVSGADNAAASWGGVYWQYFEDIDKITTAATPLQLQKKLFIETNADRGPVLTPVKDGQKLKIGDKIKVRIELRADRDMEYVHMKDMRASSLEPVNVLSSYKWQDGLGYYESTKDASANFFFDRLRKGTYVFEYTLFVTHSGNFSNGVTTIQCMYAPEFSAHSEGIRIRVE